MKLSKTRNVFGHSTKHFYVNELEHHCNQNVSLFSCTGLENQTKVVKTVHTREVL